MAISVGTITSADTGGSATTSFTVSATVDASATLLIVAVTNLANGNFPTGVTWNGAAMTQKVQKIGSSGASGVGTTIFSLLNPATGTHNLVVTTAISDLMGVGIIPIWGNDATTPIDATGGSQTAISASITTVTDNALIINAGGYDQGTAPSVANGETSRWNTGFTSTVNRQYFGATLATTTHGSITTGWTAGGTPDSASLHLAIVAIRPGTGLPPSKNAIKLQAVNRASNY